MASLLDSCGLMLEPQMGMHVEDVVGWAKYADKNGYGYLMRSDHLLPFGTKGIDSPECWSTLALIAASTERVKFGPLVSPVGFRNPVLLAKMACTLHAFSGGRLTLGMGAGWFKDEYVAAGYKFPGFRTRREQFKEAVSIVRPLVESGHVDFDGKYFAAHTDCFPRPKGKLPLIIGGKNAHLLEVVGEYADEWNLTGSSLEDLRKLRQIVDSKRGGREIQVSQMGGFIISENASQVEERVKRSLRNQGRDTDDVEGAKKRMIERGSLCGTPEEVVEQLNKRREGGIQKFYLQMMYPDKEMADLLTETLKRRA